MIDVDKYKGHTLEYGMHCARLLEHLDTEPNRRLIADALLLLEEVKRLFEEVKRLRKREATFDEFIDSLDGHNEHEWMLIERIDEIHERLHGGEEE